jgi:hypothetical protein
MRDGNELTRGLPIGVCGRRQSAPRLFGRSRAFLLAADEHRQNQGPRNVKVLIRRGLGWANFLSTAGALIAGAYQGG